MTSSSFTLAGHVFTAELPASSADPQVWTITVAKGDVIVRTETIPLMYRPVFGPDVGDVASRDARIEEIIKELGLE